MNKNKSFYILFILLSSILFFNCRQNNNPISITITSPFSDWVYSDETPILFSCDCNSKNIQWKSSIDGIIGYGVQTMVYLTFGQHTITVKDIDNNVSDSICITVIKKHNTSNNLNLITGFPYNLTNNKGKKTYGFVSLEGSAKNVSFGYLSHNLVNSYGTTIPKRDFSIKANTNLLKPLENLFLELFQIMKKIPECFM